MRLGQAEARHQELHTGGRDLKSSELLAEKARTEIVGAGAAAQWVNALP